MEVFLDYNSLKFILTMLAVIAGLLVITTKNAIVSVFNLIVLYILVAFYLIYIGIIYIGISYIIIYIGAIAILFLFVIMMIDVEVVEKRNNNYLPLLFLLLGGFFFTLKNVLYNLSTIKLRNFSYERYNLLLLDDEKRNLFQLTDINSTLDDKDKISLSMYNYNKNDSWFSLYNNEFQDNNFLLILPDWTISANKMTQVSSIGDILYTVYHSYIYIVSIILLLGMVGAIILTSENFYKTKVVSINDTKVSSIYFPRLGLKNFYLSIRILFMLNYRYILLFNISNMFYNNCNRVLKKFKSFFSLGFKFKFMKNIYLSNFEVRKNAIFFSISPFSEAILNNDKYFGNISINLKYYIIANIIIGLLLLFVNSYFSLSVKYLEKGGGFECGFTSFVQTRERFNVIFYRVSLLFLIFDLEIILAFPYPAIYQKNQDISRNNLLIFLYILVVGFIYELKEGALDIVKKVNL
jgi:NADH-ubiquinone oxidoreductase chain 6